MSPPALRRVFAGIDEAGFGPILGPLTIGFTVFEAPAERENLWRLLAGQVAKEPGTARKRFVVNDSKVVFARNPEGRARLEATAAGFLALLHQDRVPPSDARSLLFGTPNELALQESEIARHPWYGCLPVPLLREVAPRSLELRVERLHRLMVEREVRLLDAGVRVVPEGFLNHSYARTRSKGATLWEVTAPILRYLWSRWADRDLRVVVDRHGGRFHYRELLGQLFSDCTLECAQETPHLSEYRLIGRSTSLRIAFAERAESRSFSVALASCIAKYARETGMHGFNSYFGGLQPGLKPTAGYYKDGWRWLDEAAMALERACLGPGLLVRER